MRKFLAVIAFGGMLFPAQAQHFYRCGNLVSQTPCGEDAKPVSSYRGFAAAGKGDARDRTTNMTAACTEWLRNMPSWKDRDSVKIQSVQRIKTDVETINGLPTIIVRYSAIVNAKNSYGGYTGEKSATCYANEQETKIVHGYVSQ